MSVIIIKCGSCQYDNKVEFSPDLGGKRILFNCKNEACDHKIKFMMPTVYTEDRSTVIYRNQNINPTDAFLIFKSEDQSYNYQIKDGIQVIGRKSSNKYPDIALEIEDQTVSRMHCIIDAFKNHDTRCYVIKEYKSKNGTYLNGVKLTEDDEIYLEDGDEVQIGNTCLIFKIFNKN